MELRVGDIYKSPVLGRYIQIVEIISIDDHGALLYHNLLDRESLESEDSQYNRFSQEDMNSWTKVAV